MTQQPPSGTYQGYVIRKHSDGAYLSHFDPNYHEPDALYPTGSILFTFYIEEALVFENEDEALAAVSQQSRSVPLLPDGRPNRPMMAVRTVIEPLHHCDHGGRS